MTVELPDTHTLAAPGGRTITWCTLGDPQGHPVLASHGSPGSRYQLLPLHRAAQARGIRLIAPDRPGYGGTSPAVPRGFHTWDADALTLLDALELPRVALLGFSGGAGYALGLAAAAPSRVSSTMLVCGMVPGAPRATLRGRIPIVSLLYLASRWTPRLAVAMLEGRGAFRRTREANLAAWPSADQAVMTSPEAALLMAPDAEAGAAQGARSAVDDLRRYHRPLPEGLRAVRCAVHVLHGTADGNVPIGVARWAQRCLTDAELREVPGGGHYFAAAAPEAVAGWIARAIVS